MERRVRALTPDDIVNYPLKQAVRGYSVRQVDDLLDRVADEFERVHHELAEMRQRLSQSEARAEALSEAESTLKRTLVTAQRAAEQTVAEARERAAKVVEQAQEEAERKHRAAVSSAREQLDELRRNQRELAARIEAVRAFDRDYRSTLREFLERHLRSLEELEQRVPPTPSEAEDAVAEAAGPGGQRPASQPADGEPPAPAAIKREQSQPRRSKAEKASHSPEPAEAGAAEKEFDGATTQATRGSLPQADSATSFTPPDSLQDGERSVREGGGAPSRRWPVVDLSRGENVRWRVEAAFGQLHQGSNDHENEKAEEDLSAIDTLLSEEEGKETVVIIHPDSRRRGLEVVEDGHDGEGA
ncbi:MAG: DivIVA domain-containing protein [Actinomycetota bacterium]|nr:DivIVA domain-containing protein [Actinomycetota bacterium]